MVARVTPTNASVAVSSSKPRVSVQVVAPQTGVTYVLPVTAVSYILLNVGAELDVSGRYQFKADAFAVLDAQFIAFTKALADSQPVEDEISHKDFGKNRTDQFSVSDVISKVVEFVRSFADSTGTSDAVAIDTLKGLFDSVSETDTQRFDHTKLIPDGVAMNDQADATDGFAFSFAHSTTNLAFISDQAVKDISKALADSQSIQDSLAIVFDKPMDMDTFVVVDLASIQASLNKQDSFAVSDAAAKEFAKTITGDTTSYTDSVSLAPGLVKTETIAAEDAGSLLSQGYCDFTYFAEDYVGETRTFT